VRTPTWIAALALLLAPLAAGQEETPPEGEPTPAESPAPAPGPDGAGDDSGARIVAGVPYFPLAPGHRWLYKVHYEIDPVDGEAEEGSQENHRLEAYTTDPQLIDGDPVGVLEWTLDGDLAQRSFFVQEGDSIRCIRRIQGFGQHMKEFVLDPPQTILLSGLEVGLSWEWKGTVDGVDGTQRFEVLREEEVETEFGGFTALVVQVDFDGEDDSQGRTTRWLVEGVGIVKEVNRVETAQWVFRSEGSLVGFQRSRR